MGEACGLAHIAGLALGLGGGTPPNGSSILDRPAFVGNNTKRGFSYCLPISFIYKL